jgi:hypothetical protein
MLLLRAGPYTRNSSDQPRGRIASLALAVVEPLNKTIRTSGLSRFLPKRQMEFCARTAADRTFHARPCFMRIAWNVGGRAAIAPPRTSVSPMQEE